MATSRHHLTPSRSSRIRVSSSATSFASAERDGGLERDHESSTMRDKDWDTEREHMSNAREPVSFKEKDRGERVRERDREYERSRHRDQERERDRARDRERDVPSRSQVRYSEIDRHQSPLQRPSPAHGIATGFSHPTSTSSSSSSDRSEGLQAAVSSGLETEVKERRKDWDREPGELSSGSRSEDGALPGRQDSESPVPRKRKYSPIVWDLDEKQTGLKPSGGSGSARIGEARQRLSTTPPISTAMTSLASPSPPPPPSLPPSMHQTPSPGANTGQSSLLNRSITPSPSSLVSPQANIEKSAERITNDVQVEDIVLSPSSEELPEPGQFLPESPRIDDEDQEVPHVPVTIAASRWAEEISSPKSARSPSGKVRARKFASLDSEEEGFSPEQDGSRSGHSTSPEPGEYIKEKTEVNSGKVKGFSNDSGAPRVGGSKDFEVDVRMEELSEEELNKRELMELDDEVDTEDILEEQRPELESDGDHSPLTPAPPPHQRSIDMLKGCRSVDEFERLNKIDEGTYGVVYRARDKNTGEIVALKKVKMEKEREGFPMTSLREINVLLSFHHPSVVDVKEVVVGSNLDSIFMVMEYMEHDLKSLMETMKQPFSQSEVKCLMLQLFEGVKYLHDNWVLHRDLKTSNLLLNNRGELKICDFGLARQYGSPLKTYTRMVVTLWYRAPELLLGAKKYSTAIDMWSLGCIMAEFLAKEPLFNGKSEIDQIDKVIVFLGYFKVGNLGYFFEHSIFKNRIKF
ncbi:hypothetical protein O6H91_02G137200 [Diphasiastrum complanatum]|uniref:Uncharacterized protein n=1 Tax=Diphasiastrum complanatum TaxID=34168 RepID=A0ACC2ELC0_DIPCM|nr:hypothetical protein O6H91_02G137200 [Diphasiastrum complanatum]